MGWLIVGGAFAFVLALLVVAEVGYKAGVRETEKRWSDVLKRSGIR